MTLPEPLHPAVIHLPLVLAALAPLVVGALLVVVVRRPALGRLWWAVIAVHALLAVSAWAAAESGEREEERVEKVVAERHIEAHEEAAEVLIGAAFASLLLAAGGLLPGRIGASARFLTLAGALLTAGLAVRVGHSGGELVYRHGAAAAYVDAEADGARDGPAGDD